MIFIQLIMGILLLPMTALVLILFNVYAKDWACLALLSFFALIYSVVCGLVFLNFMFMVWVLIMLSLLYAIRMKYMAAWLKAKSKTDQYPVAKGGITSKKHRLSLNFIFPLHFLKLLKRVLILGHARINMQTGPDLEVSELIDLILCGSKGFEIRLANAKAELYFEIQ